MKKIVVSKYKDKNRIHPDENRKKLYTPSYIVEISMNYNKNDKMLKSLFGIKQEQAVLSLSNSDIFFFESLHNISYNIDNSFTRLLNNKKYEIMISTRERMNFANKIILNSSLNPKALLYLPKMPCFLLSAYKLRLFTQHFSSHFCSLLFSIKTESILCYAYLIYSSDKS